jgi:septum formation protein
VRVVLASGSPRRRELLAAVVADFEVAAANIDEPLGDDALADAVGLATAKAEHIARERPGQIVVAADTVVFDEGALYGKPVEAEEARAMLRTLAGKSHRVVTGVAVAVDGRVQSDASVSTVTMRALTDPEIDAYVATGSPLDKAGAYAIQDDEFGLVESLDGCYCNVVGLPLWRLRTLLDRAGAPSADPGATFDRCQLCPDRPHEA